MTNLPKPDYSRIADIYDNARPMSGPSIERVVDFLFDQLGSGKGVKLLDLGCGTGRFSIPIASRLGYTVTGADQSKEMLPKAWSKEGGKNVTWELQDATRLSYEDG
jgi:ubiquinone/menaquinone biosynthesis C-methylase UbiE